MLKSSLPGYCDIDTPNELFEQFSISLDNKIRQKHIVSKPKLKRLLKIKTSSSVTNANITAFCSRCKKETLVLSNLGDDSDQQHISEKEVDVKKDVFVKASEKKVHFVADDFAINKGEIKEKADEKKVDVLDSGEKERVLEQQEITENAAFDKPSESESVPAPQPVFLARRPSIIGNNEFWLPSYCSSDNLNGEIPPKPVSPTSEAITPQPEVGISKVKVTDSDSAISACYDVSGIADSLLSGLAEFLDNIFKQTSKKHVRILQVATMLDETLAALTEDYFFVCKRVSNTFEIVDAIALKDVQKIMVSDTCALLVLEICHASSLTEFKEFVPGYSEKTESLISLMVFALSRIKNFLLDVTRLPLLTLPTCETMHNWLSRQNEDIMYTGIATAENVSQPDYEDLMDESFMMKIAGTNQFHPVLLLLRTGYLTSKCNGGCASRGCKHSVTLKLTKEKVAVMRREDSPWPNCVRLITECMDITFAGSRKASADDLMEKIYCSIQPASTDQDSLKLQVFVLVTEHYLQLFKMTANKLPVFGSPLLNLEIFDEETGGMACVIDSQGTEVGDIENLHIQSRWHLTFLEENEKLRFLTAASVEGIA